MSGISATREMIKKAYPHASWASKVDKMSEAQATAIFFRLKRQGKI
ncbi:hypothetical protein SEA_MADAMATO_54 [Streptomyces phage Madamato]|nr:hypothetical protein SEA_MADAMATO_54 [Streptomyces phage Madamato]